MGCVICDRCGGWIDLDFNCEVFSRVEYPFLDCSEFGWICLDCLDDEEAERIEEVN